MEKKNKKILKSLAVPAGFLLTAMSFTVLANETQANSRQEVEVSVEADSELESVPITFKEAQKDAVTYTDNEEKPDMVFLTSNSNNEGEHAVSQTVEADMLDILISKEEYPMIMTELGKQSRLVDNESYSNLSGYYVHPGVSWGAILKLEDDGSFWLEYNKGYSWDVGDDYPNGTCSTYHYTGTIELIRDGEFTKVAHINTIQGSYEGIEQEIIAGTRYVYNQRSLIDNPLNIVLPGAPDEYYPDKVVNYDINNERLTATTIYTESEDGSCMVYFKRDLEDYESTFEKNQKLKFEEDLNNEPEIYVPLGNQETSEYSSSIRYVDNGILDIHIDRTDISDSEWYQFAQSITFSVERVNSGTGDLLTIDAKQYSLDEGVDLNGRQRGTIHIPIVFNGLNEIDNVITIKSPHQTITVQIQRSLDTDGDGILDEYEIYGVDTNGDGTRDLRLDLMGADPWKPDIFLELEYMKEIKPENLQAILDRVARVFAQHDINLHIDAGKDSIDYVTSKKWGELSDSQVLEYKEDIYLGTEFTDGPEFEPWDKFYKTHLSDARRPYFRLCSIVDKYHYNNDRRSIGVSFQPGSSFLISMNKLDETCQEKFPGVNGYRNYVLAACIMHELGHNLGLDHGSYESTNFKPNHISVMNYMYTFVGLYQESIIPFLTTDVEHFFDNAILDFSEVDSPKITMSNINEKTAITLSDKYSDDNIVILWYSIDGKDKNGNDIISKIHRAVLTTEGIDFNSNGVMDESIELKFYLDGEYSYIVPNVVNEWNYLNISRGLGQLMGPEIGELAGTDYSLCVDDIPEGLVENIITAYLEEPTDPEDLTNPEEPTDPKESHTSKDNGPEKEESKQSTSSASNTNKETTGNVKNTDRSTGATSSWYSPFVYISTLLTSLGGVIALYKRKH